jgi:hypothetical protein
LLGNRQRLVIHNLRGDPVIALRSIVCGAVVCGASLAAAQGAAETTKLTFEQSPLGILPPGWTAAHTGSGTGSVWKVVEDRSAPGGAKVLAQTSTTGHGRFFNLCVAEATSFLNPEIRVAFKPLAGKEDQGGGLVWRYHDADNYYIARMNPLEHNFRVYKVVHGRRIQLGTATAEARAGEWHTLRIVVTGERMQAFLDGKPYLDVKDDTFGGPGKIGFWTKADAQTEFTELEISGL